MELREAIALHLAASAGVQAVDLAVINRIYWQKMPQGVIYPAISFSIVPGGWREHTMSADSGPVGTMVQISVWNVENGLTLAESLWKAIRTTLKDYSGELGGLSGTVTVDRIFVDTDPVVIWNDESKVWAIHQDYLICHTEE